MTNDEVYKGAIGLEITLHTYVDLSSAATRVIKVLSPSGASSEWIPTLGGTNDLVYLTASGDIDEVGTYLLQSYAEWGSPVCGMHWGKTVELEILDYFT